MRIASRTRITAQKTGCLIAVGLGLVLLAACQTEGDRTMSETQPIRVGISIDIPPYVIDSGTSGIEVDLVREALPDTEMVFVQMPYEQLQSAVADGRADMALAVQAFGDDAAHYSDEFVAFENFAITKKSAGLTIESIADLAGKRVLTWQEADRELGPEFEGMFAQGGTHRGDYREFADQAEQVRAFWAAEMDVIVIDKSIFQYFTEVDGHGPGEVVYHDVFPPVTEFRAAFRDASLRDKFNAGLAALCKSGRYAEILKRYHVEATTTVCDR